MGLGYMMPFTQIKVFKEPNIFQILFSLPHSQDFSNISPISNIAVLKKTLVSLYFQGEHICLFLAAVSAALSEQSIYWVLRCAGPSLGVASPSGPLEKDRGYLQEFSLLKESTWVESTLLISFWNYSTSSFFSYRRQDVDFCLTPAHLPH